MLRILSRHQINTTAWDACVATSSQRIVYGYSWYLDAVLPAPDWKWVGIVLTDESEKYQAVMPVPLRRKAVGGITYEWVVHQPFFCQLLSVFSPDNTVDSGPFFTKMADEFRYGTIVCMRQQPNRQLHFDFVEPRTTQVINLAVGYEAIYQNYSRDRKLNLRRALVAGWTIIESSDPEPLLTLFRENHATTIEGGVAAWAYAIIRKLISELRKRNMAIVRYAMHEGQLEAGALFVRDENRIIYLFNAASEVGRQGNARTLLIDQMIQENAGRPILFDFESPEKQSIRHFYRSFGASEEHFWVIRWNRLNQIERLLITAFQKIK